MARALTPASRTCGCEPHRAGAASCSALKTPLDSAPREQDDTDYIPISGNVNSHCQDRDGPTPSFRGARSASPESTITFQMRGRMDSGPAPSGASRNDKQRHRVILRRKPRLRRASKDERRRVGIAPSSFEARKGAHLRMMQPIPGFGGRCWRRATSTPNAKTPPGIGRRLYSLSV